MENQIAVDEGTKPESMNKWMKVQYADWKDNKKYKLMRRIKESLLTEDGEW